MTVSGIGEVMLKRVPNRVLELSNTSVMIDGKGVLCNDAQARSQSKFPGSKHLPLSTLQRPSLLHIQHSRAVTALRSLSSF